MTTTKYSHPSGMDLDNLGFGQTFSNHMLDVEFRQGAWQQPRIVPFGPFQMSPAMATLHYGQAVFEGLKVFQAINGRIHIFRPDRHHARLNRSCRRLCIPEVSYEVFLNGLIDLIRLDRAWIPTKRGTSLYVRPFIFASEAFLGVRVAETYRFMIITSPVGAFFKEGINPIRLTTSGEYVRAVRGGLGAAKTPANYAASLLPSNEAKKRQFTQVLWLDAVEHKYLEEVGTMNIFVRMNDELITPPLDGTILDGVTRDSVLQLTRSWGIEVSERRLTIDELMAASAQGQLTEVFGAGTAAVISPVGMIEHQGKTIIVADGKMGTLARKLYDEVTGIQYGERVDPFNWCHVV